MSHQEADKVRSFVGRAYDWLAARVGTFVRIIDTGLLLGYRLFRKVTVDWLEPYIRVAALVAAFGIVGWALWTVRQPPQHVVIPAFDRLAAIPSCPDQTVKLNQCQSVAFDMTAIAKANVERVSELEAEVAKLKADAARAVVVRYRKHRAAKSSAREDILGALAR